MTPQPNNPNRRQFMRRAGAATLGAGAAYYGGTQYAGSPVQNGQAIAPLIIAAGVGGSVALGWALREYEVVGSNPPAEGLTPDVLKNDVATTVKTRKSTNASTIIDNGNILDGVKNTGYADAKIAAIEKLNQQETETNVLAAANAAIDDYESTILGNFLKTWNESVNELLSLVSAVKNHPDIGLSNVFDNSGGTHDSRSSPYDYEMNNTLDITATEKTHTTPGGTDITYQRLNMEVDGWDLNGTHTMSWDPFNGWELSFDGTQMIRVKTGNGRIDYLKRPDWSSMRSQIESVFTDVRNNISTWVTNVYGVVQSGEIDTSEILSPREQARIASEEEGTPQALADLQALNIATDLDREAEIYIPSVDVTIYGQLSYTGDTQLEVGTVDPNATDADGNAIYPGTFYFTYDISRGEGTWSEYNPGIGGGELTFTSEPYAQTVYRVQTAAGETAEAKTSDFTDNGDGTWTVDLTDQLENAITTAEEITFNSETGETQYETIQLTETFEIRGFTDSDGNEYNKSNFERSEPQTDDNYISQEEWEEQQKRNEELIEKYEESQNDGAVGGGGIDLSAFSAFGLPGEVVGLGVAGLVAYFYSK
jgi:hypothetical protein